MIFTAVKATFDITSIQVDVASENSAISFLLGVDQQVGLVYSSGPLNYLEDEFPDDRSSLELLSTFVMIPEISFEVSSIYSNKKYHAAISKIQNLLISASTVVGESLDRSFPSEKQSSLAISLGAVILDLNTKPMLALRPLLDLLNGATTSSRLVQSSPTLQPTISCVNTVVVTRNFNFSLNCDAITGLNGVLQWQWKELYIRSLAVMPGHSCAGFVFNLALNPSELTLVPSAAAHGLGATLQAGGLRLRLIKIPPAPVSSPHGFEPSTEPTKSSKIYDVSLDSFGLIVESGLKRSLLLKVEAFPLRLKGVDMLELTRYAVDFYLGDQMLLKVSPQTIPEIIAVGRGLSDYIVLLSPKKQEDLQVKRKVRQLNLYNQGTLKISIARLDLHLVKDENSKDYLSFIAIDSYLQLDQEMLSSRSSISSKVLQQSLVIDVGGHLDSSGAAIEKKNPEGGLYIVHLQNDDQLVNVLMEVPGLFLRLKTFRQGKRVEAYFESAFDKDIEIPVKLGYYRWIADVLAAYMSGGSSSSPSGPAEESYSIDVKEYTFKPKISLMGQLTPGRLVDSALSQLGFNSPKQDLPEMVYKQLTLQVANFIEALQATLDKL
jgi:hypothetical protein